MALQTQTVNISLTGGVDEKTSSKHVIPGKFQALYNGRLRKVGEVDRRYGNTLVSILNEGVNMSVNARLGAFEKELLVFDKTTDGRTYCSSYSQKTGQMEQMGQASEAVVTEEDAHFDAAGLYQQDIAYGNGVIITVWSNTATSQDGTIYYMVRDATTGTMIIKPTSVVGTTHRKPRVCFCGSTGIIVCQNGVNLVAYTVNSGTFALSAGTNIRTDNVSYGDFDISGGSTKWVLCYQDSGGGADLNVFSYNSSLAQQGTATSAYVPTTGPSVKYPIACHYTEDTDLWVFFVDVDAGAGTNEPVVTWFNPSAMTEAVAPITMAAIGSNGMSNGTIVRNYYGSTESAAYAFDHATGWTNPANAYAYAGRVTRSGTTLTNSIAYTTRLIPNCSVVGKMFSEGGRAYFFGTCGGASVDTDYLVTSRAALSYSTVLIDPKLGTSDLTTTDLVRPVGAAAMRYSMWDRFANAAGTGYGPCSVINTATGVYQTMARIRTEACRGTTGAYSTSTLTGTFIGGSGLSSFKANFAHSNKQQGATFGELACFSGGVNSFYDGRTHGEIGFVSYPEILDGSLAGAAGALGAGDYAWIVCYTFTDERGNVHRSAPSLPLTLTALALQTATISVPNLFITQLNDANSGYLPRMGIELYRTEINQTSGPFYLSGTAAVTGATYSAGNSTVSDGIADTVLRTGRKLYTTGGIVDNVMPPSFLSMIAHRGRLFGIDGKRVWFSKLLVAGEGPAFADEFTLDFDSDEDLTALASMDDKVVVFSRNSIYIITGRGPDDTANGNDYEITKISSDRGCIEPRSVVNTPIGMFFQSDLGIYLLSRGLEVSWIGEEISDTVDAFPSITSARVHPVEPLVYFTCNASSLASGGKRVVYDYTLNQWMIDTMAGRVPGSSTINVPLTNGAGAPMLSAVNVDGAYYWQDGYGYIYKEDTSIYHDDSNSWVQRYILFAPINMNGIAGFQRVRYLYLNGTVSTASNVTIQTYLDDGGPSTSKVFTPAVSQMRVDLHPQLCRTLKIEILDETASPQGVGRGMILTNLSMEVGVHPGGDRVPAANRKG